MSDRSPGGVTEEVWEALDAAVDEAATLAAHRCDTGAAQALWALIPTSPGAAPDALTVVIAEQRRLGTWTRRMDPGTWCSDAMGQATQLVDLLGPSGTGRRAAKLQRLELGWALSRGESGAPERERLRAAVLGDPAAAATCAVSIANKLGILLWHWQRGH